MSNLFIGDIPRLEAAYEDKGSDYCVVITHPHSLMGGNMHNNVVMTAWDAALLTGTSVLRFNFRGVGRSSGSFDEGNGEIDDIAAAVDYVKKPVIIIGYSFGAWVAARYMKRAVNPLPCLFVSPPTGIFPFPSMKEENVRAITGEQDQFCNISSLEALMDKTRLTVVKQVDHFWFGDEKILKTYLFDELQKLISA